MFGYLKKLYESELYSNANQLATIILSAFKQDRSVLSAEQYFLTLCYYGNSLYEERLYRRSEEMFRNALLAQKDFMKVKPALGSYDISVNNFSEIEIRYKLALCYQATSQFTEAVATLQVIPLKNRPAKINQLLFKLLQVSGYGKNAVGPLKALLKECPMNLIAIKALLALGVKATEIFALIGDDVSTSVKEWLNHYIDAYNKMHLSQFAAAIESLKAIETNNEMILVLIGECYHYIGDSDKAIKYLKRAHQLNQHLTDGLTTLAAVYGNMNCLDELEKLMPPNFNLTDTTTEYWFILAQHSYCQGKNDRAAYFVQKSYYLKPNNTEASLLKVKIFISLKRYKDALGNLRALEEIAPYRFEIYELLVDCYLATNRYRDAQDISRRLFKRQGAHIDARTYVLAAKTYFSQEERHIKIKAKSYIEKALEKEPYCLPAVLMMVDLLLDSGDSASAVKLVTNYCTVKPNSKLHSMLGDILSKEKNHMKAVEHYTIAINMDPLDRRAINGLMAIGQTSKSNDDTEQDRTYAYEEMLEVPTNAQAEAESESDAPWSDIEIETR